MHWPLASLTTAALALLTAPRAQDVATDVVPSSRFTSLNRTFLIDLPADFRQLAPNEASRLREQQAAAPDWCFTSPYAFYAIGPVDRWLAGDIATPWLYVMEQEEEWLVDGDFSAQLAARWRENGAARGIEHGLSEVREVEIGPQAHRVWRALRTTTLADGRQIRSIDVYAPTGGRQVTVTLRAWAADFERRRPEFEKWLSTLTFSRQSRGEQSLSDRLWTPMLTGALVGLVLLALYKHNRRGR